MFMNFFNVPRTTQNLSQVHVLVPLINIDIALKMMKVGSKQNVLLKQVNINIPIQLMFGKVA